MNAVKLCLVLLALTVATATSAMAKDGKDNHRAAPSVRP